MSPTCDFYDWARHRRCGRRARWATRQSAWYRHETQHYCARHRPPRAKRLAWFIPRAS